MGITAQQVKKLRDITGIGFMPCKQALQETDGDIDKAIDYLRRNGVKIDEKRQREAKEGICYAYACKFFPCGIIMEVNTETDFASRSDVISNLVDDLAVSIFYDEYDDVQRKINEAISVLGENVVLSRYAKEWGNVVFAYNHHNRISVLVLFEADLDERDYLQEIGMNIAMQVASMNPQWLRRDDIPADRFKKEKEIVLESTRKHYKNTSEEIIERIATGKLNKELNNMCLLSQPYIKDNKKTVEEYINSALKDLGIEAKIIKFIRYELGEDKNK